MDASNKSGGVAAVDRALSILAVFGDHDEALTLAELAARSGLYKSTILRLAESLARYGYLRRLPDGRYHVGPEPLRLANLYQRWFRLHDVVVPVLRRLAQASGETASFYVREGEMRVCLHRAEPARVVRVFLREGDRLPLDRGAAGKVLRAFGAARGAALDDVRRRMYAVSYGERDPETAAIACPVFGVMDELRGALNFSGVRERFTVQHVAKLRALLFAAAAELTHTLGGDTEKFELRAGVERTTQAKEQAHG